MSLLDRYNTATDGNAFKSRTLQVSDQNITNGVDFMDAGTRSSVAKDSMQEQFKRQVPGTKEFVQGPNTTTYSQDEKKGLSKWFGRALNYAFTDPKAPGNSLQTSVWNIHKLIRNSKEGAKETWTQPDGKSYANFHRYIPTSNFASKLSGDTALRALPKAKPAAPTQS